MGDSVEDVNTPGTVSPDLLESKVEIQNLDDEAGELEAAPPRDKWGSKVSYILTLVGYAVGFGNIWRFPYQVRENGGLVFLIPYCIMLAVLGIPIFFLELAIGQRRRKGMIYAWSEVCPPLGGIGIACAWLCFLSGFYYNTLIAYCLSYFVDSFRNPLPWTTCKTVSDDKSLQNECANKLDGRSTKYYWHRGTLDISAGYEIPGNYSPYLALYLVIAWTTIYAILVKGTKSVGLVVYFTAVFPYLVLVIFFIANLCIEPEKGWLGAYRLLKPDWSYLYNPTTWLKAGSQIFFSLGVGYGCIVVFASYNSARNNCHKDAINVSLVNCGTSLFAALVVFPMVGLLGHHKYEECFNEMKSYLPMSKMATEAGTYDQKYDIYFLTNATKWEGVSEKDPILVLYQYFEMDKEKLAKFWEYKDYVHTHDFITEIKTITKKMENKFVRHCSIGQEATASGGGTGFVFMGFTEAVKHMPGSNFFSIIFFLMLLTLGIDSGFGTVEGCIAGLEDITQWSRVICTSVVTGLMALFAVIIFPFGWGVYVLDLVDQYTANWTLLVIAILEFVAVAWYYGLAKISYDIRLMTGSKPNMYILLCWKYVSPAFIILLLTGSVVKYGLDIKKNHGILYTAFDPNDKDATGGDVSIPMPGYCVAIGFLLLLFCVMWVPLHAFLRKTRFSIFKDQAPAEFPEEELREERSIHVLREEDQFTKVEKAIMGRGSLMNLQEQRDKTVKRTESLSNKGSMTSVK